MLASLARLGLEPQVVTFGVEDYRSYPANRLVRLSGPLEVMSVFEKKWRETVQVRPSAILVNGWELAVSTSRLCPGVPLAVALDTTPRLLLQQTRHLGPTLPRRVVAEAAECVYSSCFRRMSPGVRTWLPMSTWCRESLVAHYGVSASQCEVTFSPQPSAPQRQTESRNDRLLRALFVGNDFIRKGGHLLLDLLRGSARNVMHLTIVSNDPVVPELTKGLPVRVVAGLRTPSEVEPHYLEADILLFPSLRDQFGHVIAEAMACGVVPLVSDVGGVRDMVIPDTTGVLLPFRAPVAEWERAIQALHSDRARISRLADGARTHIQQSMSLFNLDHVMYKSMRSLGVTTLNEPSAIS